jgi:phosphohistidine phosphatase
MIELYLIRHGVAEERGEAWPDDSKRPLTAKGMSKLRTAAKGLVRLGVSFDVVVSSPLVRTRQTAEIIAGGLEPHPHIAMLDSLAPGGSITTVLTDLEKFAKHERVALVGHEPGIGELAARLIGSRHAIPFKKGAVCCIDVDALPPSGPGDLRWLLPPKVLKGLLRK